jgi:predicted HAD superfamily Cof-like phosphohydrolase
MTRPTRIEINCETGVESIIELTDAEIAQAEADSADAAVRQHEAETKAAADAEAKASAHTKLAALGLTADEIAALSK